MKWSLFSLLLQLTYSFISSSIALFYLGSSPVIYRPVFLDRLWVNVPEIRSECKGSNLRCALPSN
jgi:hypothetical protein